jgi:hypothetical protein
MGDTRGGKVLGNNLIIEEVLTPQIDGLKTLFDIGNNYVSGTMMVYVNGLRVQKGIGNDYIEVGNNQIDFSYVITVTEKIWIDYVKN